MSIYRTARTFLDLAIDAVEATLYAVFDFSRVADEIWADTTSRSSSAALPPSAAADDQPGGSIPHQDVEPPGLHTIAQACERIDLLEGEVEALQRVNQRLKSELDTAWAERDQAQMVASYYKYPHK